MTVSRVVRYRRHSKITGLEISLSRGQNNLHLGSESPSSLYVSCKPQHLRTRMPGHLHPIRQELVSGSSRDISTIHGMPLCYSGNRRRDPVDAPDCHCQRRSGDNHGLAALGRSGDCHSLVHHCNTSTLWGPSSGPCCVVPPKPVGDFLCVRD